MSCLLPCSFLLVGIFLHLLIRHFPLARGNYRLARDMPIFTVTPLLPGPCLARIRPTVATAAEPGPGNCFCCGRAYRD